MAYANAPAGSASGVWLTDRKNVLKFTGDYRDHVHLEDPNTPMYKAQSGLPSLPVATLEESTKIYLESLKPLTNPEELATARQHVAAFLQSGGRGEELQRRLEARAKACPDSSWLQQWWNQGSYLDYRDPVVVFVSYFFHFADLPIGFREDQISRAAMLLHGALRFRQKVACRQDIGRGNVCHTPLKYMYNSCRVPMPTRDNTVIYSPSDDANNHVVVICKHQFFSLPVTNGASKMWEPYSISHIAAQLRRISDEASAGKTKGAPAIGAFTGGNRDAWATARQQLVSDGHKSFLEAVQSAILVVCLEDAEPCTRDEVARELWHGNGDARNRWYDKTHQIVVFANGKAGMVGEHSQFDGQPSVTAADFMLKYEREVISMVRSGQLNLSSQNMPVQSLPKIQNLSLQLLKTGWSKESEWALMNAEREMKDLASKHDVATLSFRLGGKKMIKSFKLSPDAFAQMAIQLAYYRKFGTQRATYEPLSMATYRHGRTETIRVVSSESKVFVQSMCDANVSESQRLAALRSAASQHVKYIKTAARGAACDRHMWGLRKCIRPGESLPAIFADPTYWRTCTWHISTSNLSNDLFDGWGWGEVVPDGLGIAYSTNSDVLLFNVASCRGWSSDMCARIEQALLDMCQTCMAGSSKV